MVGARQIEVGLRRLRGDDADTPLQTLTLSWTPRSGSARKGVGHEPSGAHNLDAQTRDVLLAAIGRARIWIRDLTEGRARSFDEIACREGKGERHVRLLASLAFVSPRIVAAIVDGNAPAGLTVTGLARALPAGWAEQERQIGIV